MNRIKKYKDMNESVIFLYDEEFEVFDDRFEQILNPDNYDTTVKIDLLYYVEIGFKIILEECLIYKIVPVKEIMKIMVDRIKGYAETYFLTYDGDLEYENELSWIVNDFFHELKKIQPEEYEKYEIVNMKNDFNI